MHNYIKTKQGLGSGTYGEVTKAYIKNEDGSAGRAVAIKKLFLQKQAVEGLDITALRDIKFLRELSHPNIVEVRFGRFCFPLNFWSHFIGYVTFYLDLLYYRHLQESLIYNISTKLSARACD